MHTSLRDTGSARRFGFGDVAARQGTRGLAFCQLELKDDKPGVTKGSLADREVEFPHPTKVFVKKGCDLIAIGQNPLSRLQEQLGRNMPFFRSLSLFQRALGGVKYAQEYCLSASRNSLYN